MDLSYETGNLFPGGLLVSLDLLHKSEKPLPSPPRNGEGARFLPREKKDSSLLISPFREEREGSGGLLAQRDVVRGVDLAFARGLLNN